MRSRTGRVGGQFGAGQFAMEVTGGVEAERLSLCTRDCR